MRKNFIPYDQKQMLLLPPSLSDWLPDDHLSRFVSDTVDELDLKKFCEKVQKGSRGRRAYHPRMMLKILIYSYSVGIFSSRKISAGLEDLVPLRYLAAGNDPSHRTIARFRKTHVGDFHKLFVQVVQIAIETGLVKMGTIAIDGSKIKANASKHKAMSYERMKAEEKRLRAEIRKITKMADDIDATEDEEFGPDFRGDELPEELRRREDRLKKIREAKARLEKEQMAKDEASGHGESFEKTGHNKPKRKKGKPPDSQQSNFTDPESRIMGNPRKGFVQGYNGQIAVDEKEQLIIAAELTQCASDAGQLIPMIEAARENTKKQPKRVLADAGYKSEDALKQLEDWNIDGHVALGKGEGKPKKSSLKPATARMQRKRKTKRSQNHYRKRKHIVEPVFGWIKSIVEFRSFSMRGLENAQGEWKLVCLATNLRRMNKQMIWV